MKAQGRLGDQAFCSADGHGCPACPHPVIGPAIRGSSDVLVNGLSALREADPGIHAACCGPNSWNAAGGAPYVLINNRRAFRKGDASQHCGGKGKLIVGSGNVFVGDKGGSSRDPALAYCRGFQLKYEGVNEPVANRPYRLTLPDGSVIEGETDGEGYTQMIFWPSSGELKLEILEEDY